jgi:curli biogenesis system outer membrane secretion channel CsgG
MLARIVGLLLAVFLVVPASAQRDKPIVGIAEMQDLARTGQADTFATMLETAIIGSGKFRIIERERLAPLLKEQGLAGTGLVTTNRPGQTGGFEGVDYLIYGSITSISAVEKSNFGMSLLRGVLGGQRNSGPNDCTNTDVRMEADIRITDTNSGEVLYAKRVTEVQQSATVCSGGAQIDSGALMRAAADQIATGLVTTLFPIQVAAIQGSGSVILNYGDGAVRQGDFLMVYGEATEIPDPAGGGTIRIDGDKLGALQVTEVQTSFSRAVQVTPFTVPLTVGTIARPATEDDVQFLQCQANPKKRNCKRR